MNTCPDCHAHLNRAAATACGARPDVFGAPPATRHDSCPACDYVDPTPSTFARVTLEPKS